MNTQKINHIKQEQKILIKDDLDAMFPYWQYKTCGNDVLAVKTVVNK